ncbi:MAG: c-type cytochrome [[Pasteurella] mairii]|uniref:Tetratricopeptide-like helical family protein n=1 Tax=[Pasteurella] mairii TaxID=757 RepID=A0A379B3Y3_9PAST|nr:c-type cytochrome [[Pasteurella] mairii]SUB33211.1 tetratricopeptide-like helical family protein [[Pasteurella] mairii]
MKKIATTLLLLSLVSVSSITASAQADLAQGEKLFRQNCAMCHGKSAERSALGQSAIINTLNKEEIITALQKRKSGEISGAGNAVKARLSEQDIENVASYVPTLK